MVERKRDRAHTEPTPARADGGAKAAKKKPKPKAISENPAAGLALLRRARRGR